MKLIVLIFFLLFCYKAGAEEWTREGSGFSSSEEFKLSNDSIVIHYKNQITWKDSIGNYGYAKCFGLIVTNNLKEIIDYSMYCNYFDQDKDQFTNKYIRNKDLEGGVGSSLLVAGSGKWNKYQGSTCNYAIDYLNLSLFIIEKCKR